MNFRKVAFNEAMQSILQNVATVVLAFMGYKYWTLVIGAILGALLSTIFAWRAVPTRLAWPRRQDIGQAVTFGSHLVTSRICWYVYSNADLFVAGKMLGKLAAGVYSVAMTLASIPVDKVSAMVVRVAPSILSAVQDDMPVMRRYVLLMTEGLAFVTLPLSVGMALVAPEFVVLLLGEQWRPAIVPLQLLSAYAAFRSIVPIFPVVLQIIGRSKFAMQQSVFTVLVLPAAFVVGSHWGIDGIGWAWVIVYPLSTLPLFYVTFLCIGLRLSPYLKSLWPALSSTAVMAIAVNAVQNYFAQKDALALQLALEVLTGMLIYPLAYGAMHYPRLKSLREALKLLRSQ
jgi:PST family polysaccharide transporter